MAIEIVDFPIEHGGSFHSYVNVYQRVSPVALLGRQFDVTGALDDERCDDDDASCESLKMLQRRPAVRSESSMGL